jgi:hypothetical protein
MNSLSIQLKTPVISTIVDFLLSVGIPITWRPINDTTFVPGIYLENGGLIVDEEKLLYPGDLLHEAGHIATMHPHERKTLNDISSNACLDAGSEIMAIGWSCAACVFLNLDIRIVFHADGYKGQSDYLVEDFRSARYIGINLLQWAGMTYDYKNAAVFNSPPYPHMIRWLREG